MVGRFGGSSAGFVVAALNAASAASREVVVLRVLSAGILCCLAKVGDQTKAGDMSALCRYCCKSRKLQGSKFLAKTLRSERSLIRMTSIVLPWSPVNFA